MGAATAITPNAYLRAIQEETSKASNASKVAEVFCTIPKWAIDGDMPEWVESFKCAKDYILPVAWLGSAVKFKRLLSLDHADAVVKKEYDKTWYEFIGSTLATYLLFTWSAPVFTVMAACFVRNSIEVLSDNIGQVSLRDENGRYKFLKVVSAVASVAKKAVQLIGILYMKVSSRLVLIAYTANISLGLLKVAYSTCMTQNVQHWANTLAKNPLA